MRRAVSFSSPDDVIAASGRMCRGVGMAPFSSRHRLIPADAPYRLGQYIRISRHFHFSSSQFEGRHGQHTVIISTRRARHAGDET